MNIIDIKYGFAIVVLYTMTNMSYIYAQNSLRYEYSFDKEDFYIAQTDNGLSLIGCKLHNTFLLNDSTKPALPYVTARILLPANVEVTSVNLETSSSMDMGKCILASNPTAVDVNQDMEKSEVRDEPNLLYNRKQKYPSNSIEGYETTTIGGYKYLTVAYTPFAYNAVTQNLSMKNGIKIIINYRTIRQEKVPVEIAMRSVVKTIVDNPEEIEKLYAYDNSRTFKTGYLIITSNVLKNSFGALSLNKALKGYDVKITTVEDIYSNYSQYPDSVERIKRYIYDYYTEMNGLAKYVLLGGDDTIVPTRLCFCNIIINGEPVTSYEVPSDLYYVCFNEGNNTWDFNWDKNNNGIFAEIKYNEVDTDKAYLTPSLLVGRLPIRTTTQFNDYFTKLQRYERDEFTTNGYYNRILLAGKKYYGYYNDSISDVRHWGDSICHVISNNGYNADFTMLFDTPTNDTIGNFTRIKLRTNLGYGNYNLINIDTHGISTAFETEDGLFTKNDLIFNNKNAAIITTPACYVNEFTSEPSLSESFIRSNKSANIAFWGSSDSGWGVNNPNVLGTSNKLMLDFYNTLFYETGLHLGEITEVANSFIHNVINNSIYKRTPGRWVKISQTLSGDPEIYINLNQPTRINPFDITIEEDIVNMENRSDNCNGYLLCSDLDPQNEGYMQDYTQLNAIKVSGYDTDFFIEGNFIFGINEDGYTPFRSDIDYFNNVRIQNQEIKDYDLRANTFKIGSSVNSEYPDGSVSIATGRNAKFTFSSSLIISDSFECPLGSELEIIPD